MTESQSDNDNAVARRPRRINGLVVFGLIVAGLVVFNYRPAISTIYCTSDTLTPKPDIIMLGAWWCTYCYQARRYFQNNEISYCEYDIEQSAEGKRMYEKVNGRGIPVLLIGDHQLNGFDERSVESLLAELHAS